MNTAKSIMLFFASFVIVGLFVLLIDQMYPTSPMGQPDFQTYSNSNKLEDLENK